MMLIFKNSDEIKFHNDDIFLHFTGNIFGIGCSISSENAINKIIDLKQRDANKGFILLFSSMEQLEKYNFALIKNKRINNLLFQYLPGNLTTLFYTEDTRFTKISQNKKVAARIPASKVLRDFIDKIGHPIVSSSINISGETNVTDIEVILKNYETWFDYGLYDENEKQYLPLPSTVLDIIENENAELQLKCLREGSVPFSEIKESFHKPLIQFVCVGNICRSPIAEYYMSILLFQENLPFRVGSSGLLERRQLISEDTRNVLMKNGISPIQRVSIPIDENIVRNSFLLICMSIDVKKHLIQRFPDAAHKVFTFAEFTNNTADIEDPFGLDFDHFEKAFEMIKKYSDDLIKKLKDNY